MNAHAHAERHLHYDIRQQKNDPLKKRRTSISL